jgi:hypothetical protein
MAGSALGLSTPMTYPISPLTQAGPLALQSFYGQPLTSVGPANSTLPVNPFVMQQYLLQLLQTLPQQLQHLQQLGYQQQQQIQQQQQVLQIIPSQLAQVQQMIQVALQQIQQTQQQQPLGQLVGAGGFGVTTPWGIAPQVM